MEAGVKQGEKLAQWIVPNLRNRGPWFSSALEDES